MCFAVVVVFAVAAAAAASLFSQVIHCVVLRFLFGVKRHTFFPVQFLGDNFFRVTHSLYNVVERIRHFARIVQ